MWNSESIIVGLLWLLAAVCVVVVVLALLLIHSERKRAEAERGLARAQEALAQAVHSMDLAAAIVGQTEAAVQSARGQVREFRETFGIEHLPTVPGRH
jgi:hypothetical protein